MTAVSKSQAKTDIATSFADNIVGAITPTAARTMFDEMVDSWIDTLLPGASTGTMVFWADATTPTALHLGSAGTVLGAGATAPTFFTTQGNGTKVQFAAGSTVLGDALVYDTNGNAIDAGGPPTFGIAKVDYTAQATNIAASNLIAAALAGTYRLSGVSVITQAATTSSTLPQVVVGWTDKDTSTSQVLTLRLTSNANSVGTNGPDNAEGTCIEVKASTAITYSTSNYTSSGVTALQYALHLKAEYLGP